MLKAVNTVAALLCISAVGGLASMRTANMGCKFGIIGVFSDLVSTFCAMRAEVVLVGLALMAVGGAFGLAVGYKVVPIALLQAVAAFHSLVGLAATSTSIGSFYDNPVAGASLHNSAAIVGDFIGGVTLTGSIVAFLRLHDLKSSKALNLPGKNFLNLFGLFAFYLLNSCPRSSRARAWGASWACLRT